MVRHNSFPFRLTFRASEEGAESDTLLPVSAEELNSKLSTTGLLYHTVENELGRQRLVAPGITKILSASFLHPELETDNVYNADALAVLIDPKKVNFIGYGPCDLHSGERLDMPSEAPENGIIDHDSVEYMKWRLQKWRLQHTDYCPSTTSAFSVAEMQKLEHKLREAEETKNLHGRYNECVVELHDEKAVLAVVASKGMQMDDAKLEKVWKPGLPVVKRIYDTTTKKNSFALYEPPRSVVYDEPSRSVVYVQTMMELEQLQVYFMDAIGSIEDIKELGSDKYSIKFSTPEVARMATLLDKIFVNGEELRVTQDF